MENTKSILRIFDNPEFGKVRAVSVNGAPWFVGKDIAEILKYQRTADAISSHVDDEDKGVGKIQTPGGMQKVILINESGLYSLILSSKLPNAKRFKHWVTSEVLPAIRQTGGYIPAASGMSDEEIMARALQIGERTIRKQKERIEALEADKEAMRPKAIFADAVSASNSTILIGELAKILRGNGVNVVTKTVKVTGKGQQYFINKFLKGMKEA